jgi:FAD synthetase
LEQEAKCKNNAEKYIANLEEATKTLQIQEEDKTVEQIIRLVNDYLSDARYYLSQNDCLTSIACSSYTEGLLDALRLLGKADFRWPQQGHHTKRVLVGGVFDILHPGHIYFLRKARELGTVYVVLAKDQTVLESKGRPPVLSENERAEILRELKTVTEVIIGTYPPDFKKILERVKPDIVFLGPDQSYLVPLIEKSLKEAGISAEIKQLDKRLENYSSTRIKQSIKNS